ncbi:hypothetical protein ACFOOK_04350 [Micromonospora krabiensis]|uniref:Uncharacterized protein n=1 Tax=Micromonospora krabiensis TaxID=307121 RepID=A0A1C3NDV8_9ACTN|nr:hypothetical protein [Micromonospora krabiensis]SBV30777.1 hypothetical protein GA0070620_6378 [Micromonospora krabiensis]
MDTNESRIGTDYPVGELTRAAVTASNHADAATRNRAHERFARWAAVLRGMATGRLRIGSRRPVADLPVWATPRVVRGGFATGEALAGGPLRPHEAALAELAGVPARRDALFDHHLTADGLAGLTTLLESGAYRVDLPEDAALLTVAWLVRAGDREAAAAVLDELRPYADRLCFGPVPHDGQTYGPDLVWRETAGEARDRLARRGPNPRVAAMREALTVWNPFADRLLDLWLDTVRDGRVGAEFPTGWHDRATALVARYHQLAAAHPHNGKHRRPKTNLGILRSATEETVGGRPLTARARGLLQHAIDSMVRKRGRPSSPEHRALRERQAAEAALPMLHTMARVVVSRLAALPQDLGVRSVEAVTGPVTDEEAATSGLPVGTPIPEPLRRPIRRALAGTVPELIAAGVVPSAEVLATIVPQITATAAAAPYADEVLRSLMAATYRAFRNRRSLLLTNLERQVGLDELPWVRAVAAHCAPGAGTRAAAASALHRLGELALDGFPATLLPNPLVRELATLDRESGGQLPWVEELAADIFEGTFSAKYAAAARLAGDLLTDSLYARYYDIDYAALPTGADVQRRRDAAASTSADFDALCIARAGTGPSWDVVAANGMIVEQAQILTTHNLATLVGSVRVRPLTGWHEVALRTFAVVTGLTARLARNPRPLATVKDIAYAWRQMIFFMSLPQVGDPAEVVADLWRELERTAPDVRDRLRPAVAGLAEAAVGERFDADGRGGAGRRLLGWTMNGHWLLTGSGR